MSLGDKIKKYREAQGNLSSTCSTSPEEEQKTGSEAPVNTGTTLKDKLKRYREEAPAKSLSAWGNAAYALVTNVKNNASKWHDETVYKSRYDQSQNLLGLADSWRKQYSGNEEAISYINSVVDAIINAESVAFSSNQFFSQFKDEEDYNFWDTHSTVEKRQAWYEDTKKQVGELYNELAAITGGQEAAYAATGVYIPWLDQNKGERQDRAKEIKEEIDFLETEMRNYECGNYNENGRFYGSKADDDHYHVTQTPDFAITSAERDYVNPTREELAQFDAYNDSSAWYWDADGVYRDVYGNALEVDESGNWVNPKAKGYEIVDKLGLYLSASGEELVEAAGTMQGTEDTWASIIKDGMDGSWKYLEEDEKGIYYTYLRESQEKAYRYLADMKTELNRRQTLDERGQLEKAYDDATFLQKIAMNAATIPAKFVSNVAGTIENTANTLQGSNINPYSAAYSGMHYSQEVRRDTAEELDGTGLKIPVIDFTLGDIYQTGMSRLDSALATKIFGNGGTLFLGMGAAQEEAYRLYTQGASSTQITMGAATAGAAEWFFEKYSFDRLVNGMKADTVFRWAKKSFAQGGVELYEESATELSNIITNAVIMGQQSDLSALYEENGRDWKKTGVDLVRRVTESGISGFLGGFGAGAVEGGKTYVDARTAKENFVHTNVVDTVNQTDYDKAIQQGGNLYAEGQIGYRDDRGLSQGDTFERRSQGQGDGTQSGGILSEQGGSEGKGGSAVYDSGNRGSGSAVNQSGLAQYDGSETQDNEGNVFSKEVAEQIKGTTALDTNGRPMMVYHGTPDMEFTNFAKGDTGFHFGTAEQAQKRLQDKKAKQGRMFQGYLVLNNPIVTRTDIGRWDADPFSLYLRCEGVLTDAEYAEVQNLLTGERHIDSQYEAPAAVRLREILESKGYDGTVYPNFFEGDAQSYMVFRDSQFIRAGISEYITQNNGGRAVQSGEPVTDVADRQSDSNSGAGGQLRQSAKQDDNALLLQDQREDPRRAELEQNLQSLERDLEEQEGKVAKKRARGVTAGWLAPDTKRVSILKKLIAITDNALKKLEPAKTSQSSAELQLSESGKSVESNREKVLAIFRRIDRIKREGNIITDGSHLQNGKLQTNATYQTGEHEYIYQTNSDGLIWKVYVEELKEKVHDDRLPHDRKTVGKLPGDHAGHLIGDQYGGSPKIDNLVSQAALVNLSTYKKIENQWKKAKADGKKVTIEITVNYDTGGVRPSSFTVEYVIDGKYIQKDIPNKSRGNADGKSV